MVLLREVERAFRSLILKFCKSLRSRCLLCTTGSLQAAVWERWRGEMWWTIFWSKRHCGRSTQLTLTRVLWSVLSLSRRFLKVFLKPLDFGFSGLAGGWGFLWTWTVPLFISSDGEQCGRAWTRHTVHYNNKTRVWHRRYFSYSS